MYDPHRFYDKVKPTMWYGKFTKTMFIIAEVDWDYKHEFHTQYSYDELRKLGYYDDHDYTIHLWLERYYHKMYDWLTIREIEWVGIQSGDSEDTLSHLAGGKPGNRGFTVVCVGLKNSDHITEFMLTWG
jgi:hypothetical protein